MQRPDTQPGLARKLSVADFVDAVLRITACLLGIAFLFAYHRFAGGSSELSIHVLMLSQAALMFLCAASPSRSSLAMLIALLVMLGLVVISLLLVFLGAPAKLLRDDYPVAVVAIYVAQIAIAIWFIRKHLGATFPLRHES